MRFIGHLHVLAQVHEQAGAQQHDLVAVHGEVQLAALLGRDARERRPAVCAAVPLQVRLTGHDKTDILRAVLALMGWSTSPHALLLIPDSCADTPAYPTLHCHQLPT